MMSGQGQSAMYNVGQQSQLGIYLQILMWTMSGQQTG